MISQNDSRASITVAEESTNLALAAARDGSVMKSIAVVTMLFLPGTFVSVSHRFRVTSHPGSNHPIQCRRFLQCHSSTWAMRTKSSS